MIRFKRSQDRTALWLEFRTKKTARSFGINADSALENKKSDFGRFVHIGPLFYMWWSLDPEHDVLDEVLKLFDVTKKDIHGK